ncbi:hypothetical protein [Streptomyces sp. NPDC007172]|uniref:hypothetical protein n=1 Tax=Streptomyces sp. NPDC007172 TaxID=3364776 RepID=UPI003673A6FA
MTGGRAPADPDPTLAREALVDLLEHERHRKAARDVRAEIEPLPGPIEPVQTLEGLI